MGNAEWVLGFFVDNIQIINWKLQSNLWSASSLENSL